VTCLEFHPKESFLASGSSDFTIKLFDYSKASGTTSASKGQSSEILIPLFYVYGGA
jgi:WD40 repeat protein